MAAARLVLRLYDGDTLVHEFSRSTSRPTAEGIQRMAGFAMGWLQAWADQLNDAQWQADVRRALEAQGDGSFECPRCEGQRYDVGSCQLCANTGRLPCSAWHEARKP